MTAPTTHEALAALVAAHFASNPTEPLHIHGLREDLYRAFPAVNVSSLKPLADSAKKYRWEQDHPKERTKAMDFGTIVHGLTLTPNEVPGMWVKKAFKDFRTKEAQQWRDAQTLIILDDEDLAEMTAAANAIKSDPKAGWILKRAHKEVAIFRRHERTGLLLKARLDLPFMDAENRQAVADIKKMVSIKEWKVRNAVKDYGYDLQSAFYCDMIGAVPDEKGEEHFYIIGVEEAAPNEVDIWDIGEWIPDGRAAYEALLDRLAHCLKENRWPGCSEDSATVKRLRKPVYLNQPVEEAA